MTLSLLPWCTCMGATFPIGMAAIRKTSSGESEHSFSYLYLSNVLGAILGTIIPTFFLIEMLGFRGTLSIASMLNGILAATVFMISLGRFSPADAPARPKEAGAYLPVHDLPPDREEAAMAPSEQAKVLKELSAARDRQASEKATKKPGRAVTQ